MKNGFFVCLFFISISQAVFAQFDWGVKGGLNFASANDIKLYETDLDLNTENSTGYHVGAFLKIKATRFYIRPELVYTETKSTYEVSTFKQKKIDIPILFGFKIIKPISLFAGPSFQYIIDTDFDILKLDGFENDFTTGFNIGLAAEIGFIGIDARYERSFTNNTAEFSNIDAVINSNSEQFIVSAFLKF